MANTACLNKVPYASLIAFVMSFAGAAIFCGTTYEGLRLLQETIFSDMFNFTFDWIPPTQVGSIIIAAAIGIVSVCLLVFGVFSTGETREKHYHKPKQISGGKCGAGCLMAISLLFCGLALTLLIFESVPLILWGMIKQVCTHELYLKPYFQQYLYKFNLTSYGLYSLPPGALYSITQSEKMNRFCERLSYAGPMFACSAAGTFFMTLGLLHFVVTSATNFMRIKYGHDLEDYRGEAEHDKPADED